jgi:DNA polymerase elongation subunit (family B)
MYIDAKRIGNTIKVSERDENGTRRIKTHQPPYIFYYQDDNGKYDSINGDKLHRKRYTDRRAFYGDLKRHKAKGKLIFESDIDPVNRMLEERYQMDDGPKLNICILDIEVDKDPALGWSNINNPYAIINAITIRNKWENRSYTIAVPPPTLSIDEALELLAEEDNPDGFGAMTLGDDYELVPTEGELLLRTLELIEDADVLTGWNSEYYDIPMMIQRIRIALGGEQIPKMALEDGTEEHPFDPSERSKPFLKAFGLFGALPTMRMVERFGKMEKTYQISGRVHLDYLSLYRKFTFKELHQYNLDFILQLEIKESKVALSDSLDKVYRDDFRTYIAYNRQDVDGLSRLDDKKKMIELANSMAHSAGVTLDKTLGSVAIIEQALLRKLHRNGLIAFNKPENAGGGTIPGAFVVKPIGGLYDWVWSIDINSLYPSVIRAINISPEVIIGQFDLSRTEEKYMELYIKYGGESASAGKRKTANAQAWGHFTGVLEYHMVDEETDDILTLNIEGADESVDATAKEWRRILIDNGWSISANGTVFDLAREGIVTQCMTQWYSERQEFQAKKKAARKALDVEKDETKRKQLMDDENYFDMIQMVKKIFLNSTYGAYLNAYFRFYDPRLGRSVTLTGRCITKHMIKKSCEVTTGNYDFDRDAIIYGDTDSAYCTLKKYIKDNNIEETVETVGPIADDFANQVNDSFPAFMDSGFCIGEERGSIIQAGREVVAKSGLFADDKKKRYALHVVDNEGQRFNKDGTPYSKMKVMGMEIVRSDTPAYMQKFLMECITDVVQHRKDYDYLKKKVQDFRVNTFYHMNAWERGSPCRVSKLTINAAKIDNYNEKLEEGYVGIKKPTIHFSVTAANNTNHLMKIMGEHHWDTIHDGDKIQVLQLRDNPYEMKSVALKAGEVYVPDWFKELPFDDEAHERKLVDKKLDNIIGSVLHWDFKRQDDFSDDVFEEVSFF